MARKVYYGTCLTNAENNAYNVKIDDLDIPAEDFNFQEGDLLVVFFAFQNKITSPKLVIHINETQSNVSTSNDEGKFVKTYDIISNCVDAWGAGETVTFTYTQQSTSGTYYWELVNAVHASTDVYGDTKLFDLKTTSTSASELTFPKWIITAPGAQATDTSMAVAPSMLKKLYNFLIADQSEIGLAWAPNSTSSSLQTLGTLSLTGGNSVQITYPLDSFVRDIVPQVITHTGQLTNNGAGPGTGSGEPYITRLVGAKNLVFGTNVGLSYQPASGSAVRRIILNGSNNEMVLGIDADTALTGIVLGKPTQVKGNMTLSSGNLSISNGKLTATVDSASTIGITTNGVIQEKGTDLSSRYGPLYKVLSISDSVPTIAANSPSKRNDISHLYVSALRSPDTDGWTPIGILGYNINYRNSKQPGDGYYANLWECHLYRSGEHINQIEYSIYNTNSKKSIELGIVFDVLYKKNI